MDRKQGLLNPQMVVVARESRGMTQCELAERLGINQGQLSRIEGGVRGASEPFLKQLSEILGYPEGFFTQTDTIYGFGPSELFHRRRQSLPMRGLQMIRAQVNIRRIHLTRMLRGLEIGEIRLPSIDPSEFSEGVEGVADAVRATWRLPSGPISDLTAAIENAGGIVIPIDFGTMKVDAISLSVPDMPPLFYANTHIPGDRLRFTLCHELAHIVMHHEYPAPDMEEQANRFAAQFLMPERDIRPYLRNVTLQRLAELKPYWKVSMAALLKRATDLELITPRQSRALWAQMSRLGYKTREPVDLDVPVERANLYQQIVDAYRKDMGYTPTELATMLNLTEIEARQTYFNEGKYLTLVK